MKKNERKIYTRTGDQGETSLIGGTRVPKNHKRVKAYGSVDELNSYIGLLRDLIKVQETQQFLLCIQNDLFTIQTLLAAENEKSAKTLPRLDAGNILLLENQIDQMTISLPPLESFILPGGHPTVSFCHIARCICRRAERITIDLATHFPVDMDIIKYLNRLSDYLFVLARKVSKDQNADELCWKAGAK